VGTVRIYRDKVNSGVNKRGVDFPGFHRLHQPFLNYSEHPLNESVLDHEWSACLHLLLSCFLSPGKMQKKDGTHYIAIFFLPSSTHFQETGLRLHFPFYFL
jgi:hypothetical protein